MSALRNPKHEAVAQALAAGQSAEEASKAAGYGPGSSFVANAKKRAQHHDIRRRIDEIRAPIVERQAEHAGLSLDYMLAKLRHLVDYNVSDYLTPPGKDGRRNYDIKNVSREALGRLSELTLVESKIGKETRVFQTKVKGHDPVAIMTLGAKLQGFIKEKHEHSGKDGSDLTITTLLQAVDGRTRGLPSDEPATTPQGS